MKQFQPATKLLQLLWMSEQYLPFYNTNPHFYHETKAKHFLQTELSKKSIEKSSKLNIKSNNSNAFRQTMNMKRYKYQKMAFESKPISVSNYEENLFAIQSKKSDCLDERYEPNHNSSRMMPSSSSVWVNNTKRLQKRWAMNKKRESIEEIIQANKSVNTNGCFYENTIHDLSNYFQSVKNYFASHKKKIDRERRMKIDLMNQIRSNLEQDGNLNIVRLKPSTQHQKKATRKQTISNEDLNKSRSPELIEYRSANHLKNISPQPAKFYSSTKQRTASESVENRANFQKKIVKKQDFHFIFGELKTNNSQQQQKLKLLYYRDFLWKICFNRGVILESTQETHRFYIGKGNNSRLIRKIMVKKSWWTETSQQENANFIWTQLKIYDVYKTQRCLKQSLDDQTFFLSNSDETSGMKQLDSAKTAESRCGFKIQNKHDRNNYILNESKYKLWREYIRKKGGIEKPAHEDMRQRSNVNNIDKIKITHKITNHLEYSRIVGNKKALYRTMQAYFKVNNIADWTIPLTFHITGGLQNEEYLSFLRDYYKKSKQGFSCWIVKPGELSNRGRDIKFCANLQQIKDQIKQRKTNTNGSARTYIVQLYLDKPFLYQGRKFDLRHYLMITSTNGKIRGYFYQEGYVRTTSYPYSLESNSPGVHLTNDAIQKYLPNYSKYEKANKLSYQQLNEYMLKLNPQKGFFNTIFPQIKTISKDIIFAAFPLIDPVRRQNNFQIFGIDIMIDQNYKCWLIEVNTNPCIEVNCPVLSAVIPPMLENAFTIGLDSLVTPPLGKVKIQQNNYLLQNKFELVFDEQIHGRQILLKYREENIQVGNYGDEDDNYQSCEEDDCEV